MKEKLLELKRVLWAQNWLRDLLGSGIFFCMMVCLDFGLRDIYQSAGITPSRDAIPKTFTLAWAFMVVFLLRLFPSRGQKIATGVVGALINVLYLTNALLYKAKGTFFSFSILIFAGDGFRYLDASYLQIRKLLWVGLLCGIVSVVLAVILVPPVKRGLRSRAVSLVVIALCITAINVNREKNLTDRLAVHFNIYQFSLLYDDFTDPNQCLMLAGLYQYTFRDFCLTYGIYDALGRVSHGDTVKELDEWYASKEPDPDNEWTGRFQGKNVFLIQLEAIDTWMLTEEFMPNLYRIQQESLDFTQNYTPLYLDAGTFNTEMIVNTGLVSPFTGSTASMFSRNDYPDSLAHLLTAEGYTANSFHRSGGDTYNREEVHENWGYAHYYSGEEMGFSEEEFDFDTELMRGYEAMTAQAPFLDLVITYSAHGPYQDSMVSERYYDDVAAQLPAGTNEMAIHAYAHAYATDCFIGELYDRLEADGLLDDTILVFYSDHYDYYALDEALIMESKGVNDRNLMTRTPFFIYEKNTPPMKIDKAMCQMDILPTLVNLLGLDNDGTHYVGNDAFSPNGGYAIFADYSWYDGETYWNSMGDVPPTEEIDARNAELRQRLEMSWDTMRINYFGK